MRLRSILCLKSRASPVVACRRYRPADLPERPVRFERPAIAVPGESNEACDSGRLLAGVPFVARDSRERHIQTDAEKFDSRCNLTAQTLFEVYKAIPLHSLKRAREIGLLAARRCRKLRQRRRVCRGAIVCALNCSTDAIPTFRISCSLASLLRSARTAAASYSGSGSRQSASYFSM